jgi:hypothetical protein
MDTAPCRKQGCPGRYEARPLAHRSRVGDELVVIDRVPAAVCSVCGDVLLEPGTERTIDALLRLEGAPPTADDAGPGDSAAGGGPAG